MAKRNAKSAVQAVDGAAAVMARGRREEREYVSLEDDPTVERGFEDRELAAEATGNGETRDAEESGTPAAAEKPSMHDVFGPGGFLERSMIGARCV